VWSAALRVNQDIFIQASIEYVTFLLDRIAFIDIWSAESGEAASITTSLTQANSNTDILT
jgi:hypothetical protein